MPSIVWVNENGTVCVVDVDDEGNRIDLPEAPETMPETEEPSPEPKKRGRPRKVAA